MASEQTALNVMGKALWDPTPTVTDLRAQQLAYVLGYPYGWRVVRTIESVPESFNDDDDDDLKEEDSSQQQQDQHQQKQEVFPLVSSSSAAPESQSSATKRTETSEEEVKQPDITAIKTEVTETPSSSNAEKIVSIQEDSNNESTGDNNNTDVSKDDNANNVDTHNEITTAAADVVMEVLADVLPSSNDDNDKAKSSSNDTDDDKIIDDDKNDKNKDIAKEKDDNENDNIEECITNAKPDDKIPKADIAHSADSIPMSASSTQVGTKRKRDQGGKNRVVIVDRIYAGKPGTECDMWFNHEAAMQIVDKWVGNDDDSDDDDVKTKKNVVVKPKKSTPFDQKGGHMLPRQPLYEIGDKVQVFYNDAWFDAKILKRKDTPTGFLYQVYYSTDNSKQSKVIESIIRPRVAEKDPKLTAQELGFPLNWKAYLIGGNNKWKFISPSGTVYKTKKAAYDAIKVEEQKVKDEGDPPWRTTGSIYLNKQIIWNHEHKVSARRIISLEQIGTIIGWISDTDIDTAGQPGFVSETTGKPECLYHIKFNDDPQHPYSNYLLTEIDLEEPEIIDCMILDQANAEQPTNDVQERNTKTPKEAQKDDDDPTSAKKKAGRPTKKKK